MELRYSLLVIASIFMITGCTGAYNREGVRISGPVSDQTLQVAKSYHGMANSLQDMTLVSVEIPKQSIFKEQYTGNVTSTRSFSTESQYKTNILNIVYIPTGNAKTDRSTSFTVQLEKVSHEKAWRDGTICYIAENLDISQFYDVPVKIKKHNWDANDNVPAGMPRECIAQIEYEVQYPSLSTDNVMMMYPLNQFLVTMNYRKPADQMTTENVEQMRRIVWSQIKHYFK